MASLRLILILRCSFSNVSRPGKFGGTGSGRYENLPVEEIFSPSSSKTEIKQSMNVGVPDGKCYLLTSMSSIFQLPTHQPRMTVSEEACVSVVHIYSLHFSFFVLHFMIKRGD